MHEKNDGDAGRQSGRFHLYRHSFSLSEQNGACLGVCLWKPPCSSLKQTNDKSEVKVQVSCRSRSWCLVDARFESRLHSVGSHFSPLLVEPLLLFLFGRLEEPFFRSALSSLESSPLGLVVDGLPFFR